MSIKITMLGSTGTGKTCYLYAMAKQMSVSPNGFTFEMEYGTDQYWALDEGWKNIEKGKWPEATNLTDTYSFSCSHAYNTIADFEWVDYKGGILTAKGDEIDQNCRTEIIQRMCDSFALIVCISAENLKGLVDGNADGNYIFSAYGNLLQQYRRRQNKTIPVIFAITKSDLIIKEDFEKGINILRKHVFAPLFVNGGGWFVGFVPVTLGEIKKGQIRPRNVEIPVLSCIKFVLDMKLAEREVSKKVLMEEANTLQEKAEEEKNKWFGDKNLITVLECQKEDLQISLNNLNSCIDDCKRWQNALAEVIKNAGTLLYFNGNQIG